METATQSKTLTTKLHSYWFDIGNPSEAKAYAELCEKLRTTPGRGSFMNCWASNRETSHGNGTVTAILETSCLFGNQWNTSEDSPEPFKNHRVFDWYEPIYTNRSIKAGHYLDITSEMISVRQTTLQCGYCGKLYVEGKPGFCSACLDSPYLKQEELPLLRLLPVADSFGANRAPLTPEESAELLPLYVSRQTTGSESRALKARQAQFQRIEEKYRKEKQATEEEFQGMKWLWEHSVNLENVIYYSHTQKFSFGWRQPLAPSVKSALLDLLCEFPFEYEFAQKR
jgi:hypothetical protein